MYPQYSAATSGSSLLEWKEIASKNNLNIITKTICCYPEDKKFIKAHSKLIIEKIKDTPRALCWVLEVENIEDTDEYLNIKVTTTHVNINSNAN